MQIPAMSQTWAADGTPAEVALAAPYPSSFATTVGDFLIAIPQLLEVLVPEGLPAGASEGTLATQWLDKVASCIADDLTARVLGIQKLGAKVAASSACFCDCVPRSLKSPNKANPLC